MVTQLMIPPALFPQLPNPANPRRYSVILYCLIFILFAIFLLIMIFISISWILFKPHLSRDSLQLQPDHNKSCYQIQLTLRNPTRELSSVLIIMKLFCLNEKSFSRMPAKGLFLVVEKMSQKELMFKLGSKRCCEYSMMCRRACGLAVDGIYGAAFGCDDGAARRRMGIVLARQGARVWVLLDGVLQHPFGHGGDDFLQD
ncbi:hypothetical protein L484_001756 [Morus notabilis]|uniref:Uncharacterized protein n=1 Tax=Morus notabilis TaxID=981085 RepID=W9R311_9ROSA|nr:hypothetical protein L484_001756 [Morus notabilis]